MKDGTGDIVPYRCPSCSNPEHGNLACDYSFAIAIDMEQSVLPGRMAGKVFRVMDDQLFLVHPGAPPNEDDHCCLCVSRERKPAAHGG